MQAVTSTLTRKFHKADIERNLELMVLDDDAIKTKSRSHTDVKTKKIARSQASTVVPILTKKGKPFSCSGNTSLWENLLNKDDLLRHKVHEGIGVLQGLDNLGNFLMGVGVILLGYILNANLRNHINVLFRGQEHQLWFISLLAIVTWVVSILLLLGFIYLFVFHLLAGRTLYAKNNDPLAIGQRIKLKKLEYHDYQASAPTFNDFIANNYLQHDQHSDGTLWYATFRYTRFMAMQKLMVMNKMRELLAWAIVNGVVYKMSDVFITSL